MDMLHIRLYSHRKEQRPHNCGIRQSILYYITILIGSYIDIKQLNFSSFSIANFQWKHELWNQSVLSEALLYTMPLIIQHNNFSNFLVLTLINKILHI